MKHLTKNKLLTGAYYSTDFKCAQIDEIFKYIDEDGTILSEDLNDMQLNFIQDEVARYTKSYSNLSATNKRVGQDKFYKIFDDIIECFYKEFNIKNYQKSK